MTTYRRVWTTVTGAVWVLAVIAMTLTLPPVTALTLLATMAGVGAVFGYVLAPLVPTLSRPIVGGALVGSGFTATVIGLGDVTGGWAFALLVAVPLSAPSLLGRVRRTVLLSRWPATHATHSAPSTLQGLPAALAALDDAQLATAWVRSGVAIDQATSMPGLDHLARVRGHYLDEFERRNPAAFERWLRTEPRPIERPPIQQAS